MKKFSLIIAVLLAGCGGGGNGGVSLPPVPQPTELDAFFANVSGMIASSPDDTEAPSIDAITPTAPDGSDPEPL